VARRVLAVAGSTVGDVYDRHSVEAAQLRAKSNRLVVGVRDHDRNRPRFDAQAAGKGGEQAITGVRLGGAHPVTPRIRGAPARRGSS
jgi:hypothetical protein